jgi:nitroimidazol reductase NimA-like FMN-containing flavoprotein (pyridoxamine 5'-phosphate oxidase superfamily)
MEHINYTYTTGMSEAAVADRLNEVETGVLALSNDGDAYAVPVAHYYDGDGLYFRLGITEGSRKRAFIRNTETATYLLYDTEATDAPRELDSWSILITGTLRELPEERHSEFDTAEINRRFSPIRVFDGNVDEIEISVFEFEIDAITGRKTPSG